jgi:hypothetical protein
MTLPPVNELRYGDGVYADPVQITELARFFNNANSQGVATSLVVKTSPGLLLGFTVSSVSSQFVHVFDLAALPANAAVPALSFDVTALTTRGVSWLSPRGFKNGIVIAASTTQHTLTIAVAANTIFDVQFL